MVQQDADDVLLVDTGNDRNLVIAAVRQRGEALRYAPREFQADKGVVMAAVNRKPFDESDVRMRSKAMAIAALTFPPSHIFFFQEESGLSLEFASAALQDDRRVVISAVRVSGLALQFAII